MTVLRDGRKACDSAELASLNRADVVQMMIGRAERITKRAARPQPDAAPYLELTNYASGLGHKDICLTVHPGEILGLYGFVGAGRSELAKALLGLAPQLAEEVRVAGKPVCITSVAQALHQHGLGYLSEDRKAEGLILLHSVLANAGITPWRRLANRLACLRDTTVAAAVGPVLQRLDLKTPSFNQTIGNLSGGNQQKVSVAKWIAAGVSLLIIDEPCVGIDIKTKAYLHDLIHELAGQGDLADHLRHARDYRRGRPRAGDGRLPHQGHGGKRPQ